MDTYGNERSPAAKAFLADLVAVCRKHGFSLGHEDSQGGFLVEPLDEGTVEWLLEACDRTKRPASKATAPIPAAPRVNTSAAQRLDAFLTSERGHNALLTSDVSDRRDDDSREG